MPFGRAPNSPEGQEGEDRKKFDKLQHGSGSCPVYPSHDNNRAFDVVSPRGSRTVVQGNKSSFDLSTDRQQSPDSSWLEIGQGNSTAPAKPLETITSARASKTITRLHAQTMGYEILTEAKIQRIEQWVMHVQSCASVRESLSATPPPPTTEPKGEQDAAHEDDDSDADSRPRLTESSLNSHRALLAKEAAALRNTEKKDDAALGTKRSSPGALPTGNWESSGPLGASTRLATFNRSNFKLLATSKMMAFDEGLPNPIATQRSPCWALSPIEGGPPPGTALFSERVVGVS
jgi:hypothetical protein